VSLADIIRAFITAEEFVVLGLYSITGIGLLTYRRQTEELREGRFALFVAIVCLLSVSVIDEFRLWGGPLDIHELLQQIALIGLVIGWWKIVGLRFVKLPSGNVEARSQDPPLTGGTPSPRN
jgi:hypothetical protein